MDIENNMIESVIADIPLLSKFSLTDINIQRLSGLTNKNYLLSTHQDKYILRIPRESTNAFIDRNNESHNAKIAQQLGVAPQNLWREKNLNGEYTGLSLSTYIDNTTALKLNDSVTLAKIAKTLTRLHNSKKSFKGALDNQETAKYLKKYFKLCSKEQQQLLKSNYQKTLSLLKSLWCDRPIVSSHIDLVTENILHQGNKIWLIDWEYSAMASPYWDIAMICNSTGLNDRQSENFLKLILDNYRKEDLQCLKQYQFIVKTVSECWQAAF